MTSSLPKKIRNASEWLPSAAGSLSMWKMSRSTAFCSPAHSIPRRLKFAGLVDVEVLGQPQATTKQKFSDSPSRDGSTTPEMSDADAVSVADETTHGEDEEGQNIEAGAWGHWNLKTLSMESEEKRAKLIQCAKAFKLEQRLLRNILTAGWSEPTKIQSLVVPIGVVTGKDICIASETVRGR